jgi:hypothetical protein
VGVQRGKTAHGPCYPSNGKVDEEEVPCREAGSTPIVLWTIDRKIERSAEASRAMTTARTFPS